MKSNYHIISVDNIFKIFLSSTKNVYCVNHKHLKGKLHKKDKSMIRKCSRNKFNEFMREHFHVAHVSSSNYLNKYACENMIIQDEHNFSKSFLLFDSQNTQNIFGIITIGIETAKLSNNKYSRSKIKRFLPEGKSPLVISYKDNNGEMKRDNLVPVFCIEQIAKNSKVLNNPIHGKDLIRVALHEIYKASKLVGGIAVILSAIMPHNNINGVIKIYENCGFKKRPENPIERGSIKYQHMFLRLKRLI